MLLSIDNLVIQRADRVVIDGLSASVRSGEALVLRGPNGAGKTTLIRSVAGFLRPVSGEVRLEGADDQLTVAEQCHYIGHQNGVKANLTVSENLQFWCGYLDPACGEADRRERLDAALDTFKLEALEDIPVAYLSAGQKRRAGLARLLLAKRPLWLLDEPTVSLDAASVEILAKAVAAHVDCGGMALAATHIPLGLSSSRTLELEPVAAYASQVFGEPAERSGAV